jgi:hypothetical protein
MATTLNIEVSCSSLFNAILLIILQIYGIIWNQNPHNSIYLKLSEVNKNLQGERRAGRGLRVPSSVSRVPGCLLSKRGRDPRHGAFLR